MGGDKKDKGVVLKIIQLKGHDLGTVSSCLISKSEKALIKFNINGNYFAIYDCTSSEIKIYDIGKDI